MSSPRVAWLLTSAFYYWHPMLSQLAQRLPDTKAFVANWRGYASGLEDSFAVDIVGDRKIIPLLKSKTSYGSNFTFLPLNIVNRLLQFKPQVIFSNSFGMWTLLALLSKPMGHWKVIIAYEGSSPGVDYRNSPVRLRLRRLMVKWADACITNSQAGRDYLVKLLKAPEDEVFVQPYEVPAADALAESETAIAAPAKRPCFIFVGSVKPRKGVHLLLQACVRLVEQGYQDYSVWIVGDGEQCDQLQTFCIEQGLTEQVQWLGRVEYDQLGGYFAQADVFVLPTLEDTWGMVVLEAMVLGKPILCSTLAGASELIQDGENGYRFDPRDAEVFAARMQQFIANPALVNEMGKASTAVMSRYTPAAAADFLVDVAAFAIAP
ncbi:MAG: glycosyltransferase family 4 protein [Leptolyngbyaceae cyanobacterium SM1_1_3]|nr:glycosyltransferase family 4 protein [Leptolyngbyaceae cyanobacterium SM1_1_3]NJN03781.1 glycosyltransferase family 4 protein [Leptolyngbyaceae cyanobacterium RM1_1_2]